jgi:uncharacterized protein YkwD
MAPRRGSQDETAPARRALPVCAAGASLALAAAACFGKGEARAPERAAELGGQEDDERPPFARPLGSASACAPDAEGCAGEDPIAEKEAPPGSGLAVPIEVADATRSPVPAPAAAPADAELYRRCGLADLALAQVAAALVRVRVAGGAPPEADELRELVRAAGVPHPWPRAWMLVGAGEDTMLRSLAQWAAADGDAGGERRCGIGRGALADGTLVVAAVGVQAAADLAPLPRRVAAGQWLSFEASFAREPDSAQLVLLGPSGRPRRVLSSVGGRQMRARFALDRQGRWLVQAVAALDGGPRPVLEAVVFVDAPPFASPPARGGGAEPAAGASAETLARALYERLVKARHAEGAPPLSRVSVLDGVAARHAARLARAGRLAHDLGEGGPDERAREAGIESRVGENTASAPTVARLHAALWQSPSHRENMLDASFRRVGVAVARDADGRLWAVELLAE